MKKLLFILAGLILIAGSHSWAEEPDNNEQGKLKLDAVVVSAGRIEESKKDLTVGVTVIDSEDIERSSANDLGDLLSEKGGIYLRKYPGSLTSIAIRGFRTETHGNDLKGHVLVLLDGRRVATGNVAKIATGNIERVEIIKGSAAVQYGSAAMGGLVNVITKKGEDKLSFSIEGGVGSYGFLEEGFGLSGRKDKFDVAVSVTHSSMDDYKTGTGEKYKNTGYDKKINASLNMGYEFLPKNRLGFTYTLYEADEIGSPSYITAMDLDDYKDSSNYSADLTYDGAFGESLFCKVRYFFGKDKDTFNGLTGSDPSGWDDGIPSKKETKSSGTQAQLSIIKDRYSLTTGIDWLNYENDSSKYEPYETEYDNAAVFLLGKTNFIDNRLIFSAGLRYDEYEVEVIDPAGNNEDDTKLTPSFGIAYAINEYFKIRTNYSEAFVMPAAEELAADYFSEWGTHYVGNPDLDPEKSITYEFGLDVTYKNFSSSLTFFNTKFKDKIETSINESGESTWENLGEATLSGIEGEFSGYLRGLLPFDLELKPYIVFTYLTEFEDEDADEDLQYTSKLDLSYGLSVTDLDGFSADLSAAYAGSQEVIDYQLGTYDKVKLDSSTVINFTISKTIVDSEKFGGLTVRGEVKNIADENYAYVQGYPLPGRTFCVNLKYNY